MKEKKIIDDTHKHLEKLLKNATTSEKIGFAMFFVDHYEDIGYEVTKFRICLDYKFSILNYFNYN